MDIETTLSQEKDAKITLHIYRSSTKITPEVSGEKIRFRVEVSQEGNIEFQTDAFKLSSQENLKLLESLFAKADRIEASYQNLKAKIETLPQALLAKAFRGELVEQLPEDGDAHVLLEQIKQAKAGLEKGGKGKKLKVEDEIRMVAEAGGRYGKK